MTYPQLTFLEAVEILDTYQQHDNATLLQAIAIVRAGWHGYLYDLPTLHRMIEALVTMKWDYARFVMGMPHDANNPGVQADWALCAWHERYRHIDFSRFSDKKSTTALWGFVAASGGSSS